MHKTKKKKPNKQREKILDENQNVNQSTRWKQL